MTDDTHGNIPREDSADDIDDAKDILQNTDEIETGPHRLSKSEKKRKRYEDKIAHQKLQRKRIKTQNKAQKNDVIAAESITDSVGISTQGDNDRLTKKQRLREIKAKLEEARLNGQRICVDLSLERHMSTKEHSRLAQQLCRLYGSNRAAQCPAHVYFTGLDRNGHLYSECVRKNDGFSNYIVDMTDKHLTEIFIPEEIVYLSPDSRNILTNISKDKVYVIGGLVDESITKNISLSCAESAKIVTARLPIDEYMESTSKSHSKVLSVNQVFDILLTFFETGDWGKALLAGVPPRKGYRLKQPDS